MSLVDWFSICKSIAVRTGITLCMIVKNEEDWIAGALESVRTLVNDIVIVDTGSTDLTLEKVQRFGARTFNLPWVGDFSAARNRSLEFAECSWILVLDADERISERDHDRIAAAVRSPVFDGYHLVQRNYVRESRVLGWQPNDGSYREGDEFPGYVDNPLVRLFRNTPDLRFRGVVHEIIDPVSTPLKRFGYLPVVIHHYGKVVDSSRVAAKRELYLDLGRKKLEGDPENAKAAFDLGIQYQELGRDAEAVTCFERAFDRSRSSTIRLCWAISAKRLGHTDQACRLLESAIAEGFETAEVHIELGNARLASSQVTEALDSFQRALQLEPHNPLAAFNCGLAQKRLGRPEAALEAYMRALESDPHFEEAAVEIADLRRDEPDPTPVIAILESILRVRPESRVARLTLARTHLQSGQPDLALNLLSGNDEDAMVLALRGAARLGRNELDQARTDLEHALVLDRSIVDARINLAQVYARKGLYPRAARLARSAYADVKSASLLGFLAEVERKAQEQIDSRQVATTS